MFVYKEYETEVLKELRDLILKDEDLNGVLDASDVYLYQPEGGFKDEDVIVRLSLINTTPTEIIGGKSYAVRIRVQVDVWSKDKFGSSVLSDRINNALERQWFRHESSIIDGLKEINYYKNTRLYHGVFNKK